MTSSRLLRVGIGLLPIFLLLPPQTLRAETRIKVTTTVDDFAVNGNCTLREAVIAANINAPVDRCPAGSGAERDTIVLRAGIYRLSLRGPNEDAAHTGDLDIWADLSLRGAGAATTVSEGVYSPDDNGFSDPLADRVVHVVGGDFALSGVAVRGGHCSGGAGILNAGRLLLEDSQVYGNSTEGGGCGIDFPGGVGILNLGGARRLPIHNLRKSL